MVTFWPRINTVLLLVLLMAIIGFFATRAFGGPLDPPGAPASTPGGIDGRIPISSLPFSISASGSYVVTRDLQSTLGEGITVTADNVTIDLNGFTLTGYNGLGTGIEAPSASNLTVVNGVVQKWGVGIHNAGNVGEVASGGVFRGLQVSVNGWGMHLHAGAMVDASTIRGNTQNGVVANGPAVSIVDSSFVDNYLAIIAAPRALIENNHIDIPAGRTGIVAADFTTIRHNAFTNPALTGYVTIDFGGSSYVVVVENRIKASLSIDDYGTGTYYPYDINNALTNVSP